jgi:hypothetical protein
LLALLIGRMCVYGVIKSRIFSVKSAYHLQMELEVHGQAETSTQQDNVTVWHAIWDLKEPNMEKKWRACHNILPTQRNLEMNNIITNPSCPLCGLEQETTKHIL